MRPDASPAAKVSPLRSTLPAILLWQTAPPFIVAQPTEQPLVAGYRDPVWMVHRAWSEFRLDRLQELITLAIAELHSVTPSELLGRELSALEQSALAQSQCDPIAEALKACCEELRDASGMVDAQIERATHCETVRRYIEQQPAAWSEAFAEALDKYRRAASQALQGVFAGTAAVT
jgi:hypothetical protein